MKRIVLLTFAAAMLTGCSVWPVDQDPKGMNYRRDADRVIDALQAYHHDKGTFPASLSGLTPAYLPALPDGPELRYEPYNGSLSYRYTPSWPQLRPVWCQSVGNTTEWRCQEHILEGMGSD
ncbi:MAG TPA: membrane lipoprotein lipid attachment site-containing protein [Rhizomicrobium sp.]|nr:membrane lipoprotein lipid attachment site-containing protein [Rhizomicrobium sp.]